MFSDVEFATSYFSFSSFKKASFYLINICLFATCSSGIICSRPQIFILTFLGFKEFNLWSDSPSFCTHNSCKSFKSESSFFNIFILSWAITFSDISSRRKSVKVSRFEFDTESLIEAFEFQLSKALTEFSVQDFPMKVWYQIWH